MLEDERSLRQLGKGMEAIPGKKGEPNDSYEGRQLEEAIHGA